MRNNIVLMLLLCLSSPSFGQKVSGNYVRSMTTLSETDTLTEFAFSDGLGRLYERAKLGFMPNGNDMVEYQEYNGGGQESNKWLPISIKSQSFPMNRVYVVNCSHSKYADFVPYSTVNYESSPLQRPLEVYGAGASWRGKKAANRMVYSFNTGSDGILSLALNHMGGSDVVSVGSYVVGDLDKESHYDENDNLQAAKYTNVYGDVVCTETDAGKTYNVYDAHGNLCCIIPPALSAMLQQGGSYAIDSNEDFLRYAYVYSYDEKNRCVEKRLPGCKPVRMVYDKDNHLTFSQDGNQREQGKWSVFFYDKYNRLVLKGECKMQNPPSIGNKTVVATFVIQASLGDYTVNLDLPSVTLQKVNYYDNYNFMQGLDDKRKEQLSFVSKDGYGQDIAHAKVSMTSCGLLTGSRTYQLDAPSSFTVSAYYYNGQGRVVQTRSSNFLNGYDFTYSSLDHYSGAVYRTYVEHTPTFSNNRPLHEEYVYTYDHAGRPLAGYHTITGGERMQLFANTYDELGRLVKVDNGNNPALSTAYSYNVRGWLTKAENAVMLQHLYYGDKRDAAKSVPQWNGNLSSYTCGDTSFDYSYDSCGRLVGAYSTENVGGKVEEGLHSTSYSYDSMGNLLHIQRSGVNQDTGEEGLRDDVTLEYDGNHLVRVSNAGYKDSSQDMQVDDEADLSGTECAYDANGNLVRDANKGIYLISYNALNLPEDIYSENGDWHYSYDGDGRKLAVYSVTLKTPITVPASQLMDRHFSADELAKSSSIMQRAYVGNYVYEFDAYHRGLVLTRLNLPCGYVSLPMSGAQYKYYVKDYLGSNRCVVDGQTGRVEQVSRYYPFGALYGENPSQSAQRWRFGSKELNRTFDVCDFEARWYDPPTGRFMTMDPLSESYTGITPYAFCGNDPINVMDPTGRFLIYSYKNNQGQSERYFYRQGADGTYDFYDKDGNRFNHDVEFVNRLRDAFNELRKGTYGKFLVESLAASEKGVYLFEAKENRTSPLGVMWNPASQKGAIDEKGHTRRKPFVGLGHELGHAYDPNENKFSDVWMTVGDEEILESEKYATYWENLIRKEQGMPLRKYYTIQEDKSIANPTLLLDNRGNHLFYDSTIETQNEKMYINIKKK